MVNKDYTKEQCVQVYNNFKPGPNVLTIIHTVVTTAVFVGSIITELKRENKLFGLIFSNIVLFSIVMQKVSVDFVKTTPKKEIMGKPNKPKDKIEEEVKK